MFLKQRRRHTWRKRLAKSSADSDLRMPLPPPPSLALIMTGKPIACAAAKPSSAVSTQPLRYNSVDILIFLSRKSAFKPAEKKALLVQITFQDYKVEKITRSRPRQGWYVGRLCYNTGRDFVSESPHSLLGRTNECNTVANKQLGQFWILRSVAPAGPNSLHLHSLCNVQDELHICVVVVVGSARYGDVMVRHFNIFCISCRMATEKQKY